jgi:hypothetical protein
MGITTNHARNDQRYDAAIITAERRRRTRGSDDEQADRGHLVSMILGTYREMPGLSLHLNQAARLFGLHTPTCEIVLEDLVRAGRLRRRLDGQYTWS